MVKGLLKYYGHRARLRLVGREHDVEPMNKKALELAKEVADRTGTLMAGLLCNTTIYDPNNPVSIDECRDIFKVIIKITGLGVAIEKIAGVGEVRSRRRRRLHHRRNIHGLWRGKVGFGGHQADSMMGRFKVRNTDKEKLAGSVIFPFTQTYRTSLRLVL